MAIVQRFRGGFPFFRCFMYVFTRKWGGAADFRDGEHRGGNADGTGWKNGGDCLRIPLKMSKFISNFNRGVIWIIRN